MPSGLIFNHKPSTKPLFALYLISRPSRHIVLMYTQYTSIILWTTVSILKRLLKKKLCFINSYLLYVLRNFNFENNHWNLLQANLLWIKFERISWLYLSSIFQCDVRDDNRKFHTWNVREVRFCLKQDTTDHSLNAEIGRKMYPMNTRSPTCLLILNWVTVNF